MNKIIERMRNGERITETDADFPLLYSEIENTKKLVCELNTQYHSPDEIRALLERIWGNSWTLRYECFHRSILLSAN